MTIDESDLIVVPLNMLPTEKEAHPDPHKVMEQRIYIRDHIANKSNSDLILDTDAMKLMATLGSDLMINAFACNFRVNGKINEDVVSRYPRQFESWRSGSFLFVAKPYLIYSQVEANYLNQRIFQRTAITRVNDKVNDFPIILTSTTLAQSAYKGCLTNFKNRLGLKGDQDLFVLINVTMTPWPTANNFLKTIVQDFRNIANDEVKASSPPSYLRQAINCARYRKA